MPSVAARYTLAVTETSVWPSIARERLALAEDLEHVHGKAWQTQSLCEGWTVHQTLGHVVASATTSPVGFATGMLAAGGKFSKFAAKAAAKKSAGKPDETVRALHDVVLSQTSPPGPKDTWLGEIIVHACDIRIPLGIEYGFQIADVERIAGFYSKSNALIGSKKRISDVYLRATDSAWTHGDGPEISGPLILLVLAMTGRGELVLEQLEGPGVDVLRSKLPARA